MATKYFTVMCLPLIFWMCGCRTASETDPQVLIDQLAATGRNTEAEALNAHSKLVTLETKAFDVLVADVNDPRPSWYKFAGDKQLGTPITVGEVCFGIISLQVEKYSYWKGSPNYFDYFNSENINNKNIAQWWGQNKGKSLKELQIDAVEGTIQILEADECSKSSTLNKGRITRLRSILHELQKNELLSSHG
jgi:hypothetical protein